MKELVDQISSRLKEQGIEVPQDEISARVKMLIENFRVPPAEARRSVLNYFLKEHGMTPSARPASQKVKISEITEENRWVDLEVKVLQLWEPTSSAISQTGLIGDETGRIKFTKWARDSSLPELEAGRSYLLKSVVTKAFQGRFSISLNRASRVEELSSDVQAEQPAARGPAEELKIAEIKLPGQWLDVRAKVIQLWEPTSSAISQTGLIGDETGRIKFTKWARDSSLPELEAGRSYLFKNVISAEFQGRISLNLNRTSQIDQLAEEIEASGPLSSEEAKVADIQEPGRWINLRAKVVQLWEPTSTAVSQSGLIGDETGSMKFVKWAKSGLPDLAEGRSYIIRNAITDEYQGRFSVKLNSTSQIEEISEDIAVGSQAAIFTGAMVDVQKGSGLIKRCPTCRRSLAKGLCADHGKVEGVYDLRIKAVLDDGDRVQDILMNREMTERLAGITLDQAKEMAMEALDHEVVRSQIEEKLVGRYYTVSGPRIDRYILVESIAKPPALEMNEVDDLIRMAEVI